MEKTKFKKAKTRKSLGKKSILYSILSVILIYSLFSFAGLWSALMSEKQGRIDTMNTKMNYYQDDIAGNVFYDLTTLRIKNITRDAAVTVSFDQLLMNSSFVNRAQLISNYRNFIRVNYSYLNNINATLSGFNDSLKLAPYNTTILIGTDNTYFYTMPSATNYIQSIDIVIQASKDRKSACNYPQNDPGFVPVTVTFIDPTGASCTNLVNLNPSENNDKAGEQFYFDALGATSEVKYGLINGQNGVIQIIQTNLPINITNIQISYALISEKVAIYNGQLSIISKTGNTTKTAGIVFAQE